uniref:Ion transport domain-containing protein n=1 Tax=Dendroctonus ponderosae TaxID=77166 RepID=A0AAR5PJQ1_DENPD
MQNSYKAFMFNTLELVKLGISRKKESLFSDLEATDSELSETLQTIENRSFKRVSCIKKAISLSNESLKRGILSEMRQCGSVQLLYEIADGQISAEELRNRLNEASAAQVNITLLWCALCKEYRLVEELVCLGANVRYSEHVHGMTALHVASFSGCVFSAKFLILVDRSTLNLINQYYSPLHCAVLAKNPDTARLLLDNGARINSMTNGPGYETALSIAVKVNSVDCVKLLVARDALIFQEGKLGDLSPLFLAAEMGHAECLKVMLEKKTVDCNQLRKSENGNTALHIAAEHGHSECIKVLLHNGSDPNLRNLRSACLGLRLVSIYLSICLYLVCPLDTNRLYIWRCGALVNVQDQHGFTPLHIAALNELSNCASILISNGADYSLKSNSGISAFSLIAKKTPTAFEAIKDKLTEYINLTCQSVALNEVEMCFDFKNGFHHPNEYTILNAFIDAGHKEMLLHPYITAFLYVTWARMRRCYYGMIYNSLVFSLILLFYVLTSLAYDCDRKIHDPRLANTTVHCSNRSYLNAFLRSGPLSLQTQWYILLYFTLSLAYRKVYGFHGYPSLKQYCTNWGNVLEWTGIIYVFIISFVYTGRVESWQVHAGAFAVMCSWTNIMYLLGQLPVFGPYVEMFQKVQSEFQKLLLVFFPFLVGFTIGFCIIFPNSAAFHNPFTGIISALVMMTGDMNYDLLLEYSSRDNSSDFAMISSQIAYTFFLLFITIILMNLLVGIAVHDIQGLQKNADLSRLVRQAKMCSYIEMSHYKRGRFARSIMALLRVVPKPYVPVLRVKPLDPMDTPIPKEVIQAAYDLAKKRDTEKINIFSRTESAGGPWRRAVSGSLKQHRLEQSRHKDACFNALLIKVDQQTDQIGSLLQELAEVKQLIKSSHSFLPAH